MNDRISQSLGGVIDLREQRGIHVTWHARKLITDNLVNALELTWHLNNDKPVSGKLSNWVWPIRQEFVNTWPVH